MSVMLSKLRLSVAAAALFGFLCISFAQAAVTTTYINLGAGGNCFVASAVTSRRQPERPDRYFCNASELELHQQLHMHRTR